ncbi:MAG TPA: sigma-70 family RNA polymerase sigma factor [Vicinamibacterales bacterium]
MTDADLFEAFVRRYQDMVFATAVRLLGNPTEAEDVAQTVFLRAFQRFEELGPSPTAAGWLKTVTRNTCLNHLSRYRRRWRFFSELATTDDTSEEFEQREIVSVQPSITEDLEHAERQQQLERALRQLPDHQRVPLVLFHFEDLSYQAIATALGVSLGKVKTDIHRGREALRQLMGEE